MKILQVIHDFLPRHQAGSELYCYHLSRSLKKRGHDVRLFYSEIDHNSPAYSTRQGEIDGLPFVEIVNNHGYAGFEETYRNPAVESVFRRVLDDFQPDIVHFHHLHSLSFGCIELCRQIGAPVVFTLHDYWLTCPRGGGQRFRGEGKVCHDVDPSLCAECISTAAFAHHGGSRLVKRILNRLDRPGDETLLTAMRRGRINTPCAEYVASGVLDIDGDARRVLFMHPPASVTIKAKLSPSTRLQTAIAMAPAAYDREGDGVMFRVRQDGETVFERALDAKHDPEDRGWIGVAIDLKPSNGVSRLTFETQAYPNGRNEFCSAAWAEPRLIDGEARAYTPSLTSRFRGWVEAWSGRWRRKELTHKVMKRREAALKLFHDVDLFISPSPFLRKKFIEYGMPEEKIVFSDYGIAVDGYDASPRDPKRPIHFTYVGTLVEHKGLHVLIDAFNRLPHDGAILNVYGALNEFTGYVKRIQEFISHPGIRLRGRAENQDIPRILSESDALIVPSIWFENSPITIHEAFLSRKPVITSRFGGMADLVRDGENGLLFDVGDADQLARQLRRCVDDPSLLIQLRPDPAEVKPMASDAEWMEAQYQRLRKEQ
ncbi:MAG: glycosyltransferase [bacterium]|nr:glycosyltransferase [bacterium]